MCCVNFNSYFKMNIRISEYNLNSDKTSIWLEKYSRKFNKMFPSRLDKPIKREMLSYVTLMSSIENTIIDNNIYGYIHQLDVFISMASYSCAAVIN